mmetsp:Transcript_3362/g.7012  ORF Transcript_3362/g.7012 Transcript_3362/m.7012 type:complete len:332 (-) Transcript_3362:148-1143(-)
MAAAVDDAAEAVGNLAVSDAAADYSATESEDEDGGEMPEFVPRARPAGRKCSVMAGVVKVEEGWTPPVFDKSEENKAMLDARVKGIFFMAHLTQVDVDTLVGAFENKVYAVGDILMTQGEEGDCFYVIESGKTDVIVDIEGSPTKVAEKDGEGENNFVGELALLYNAPRSATIKATTEVTSWSLDRTTFKTIMQESATAANDKHRAFLDKVPILNSLSDMEKMQLADALKVKVYKAGDLIIKEGDDGDDFFIVEEGEVVCTKNKGGVEVEVSPQLGAGNFFGELALLNDDKRQASVKATTPEVECLTIDRKTFKRMLGPLEEILKGQEYSP